MINYDSAINMAEKFREAEEQVATERGGFYLFGLFERERTPGRWDLVASAPWLKTDRDGTLDIMISLRDKMKTDDWKMIGGVFPIEPSASYVEWITKNYHLQHQLEEIHRTDFGNVHIGHAYLITSNDAPSPVVQEPVAA